jgi:hypothetical protein
MLRSRPTWVLPAVALIAFTFGGCGEEESKVTTPEPAIVVTLTATPDSLDTGGKVSVEATLDTEGVGPFVYRWHATGGRFSAADAESTGWTAPDDPGLYTLSVMVTDGHDAGFATADIGVGAYVPADSPFYRGAAYCAVCHNESEEEDDYYDKWAASAHASAFETLREEGAQETVYCTPCHTVGSNGLDADAALDNGGYDERAVTYLEGVQCENCHGPGSAHPNDGDEELPSDLSAELCQACHEGEHHPTYTEWSRSLHGSALIEDPAMRGGSSQCFKCHNGLYAKDYLDTPLNYTNQATPTDSLRLTCVVCHDPHGNGNRANLRDAINDVTLPGGLHPQIGAGRLCVACHNGRRDTNRILRQINEGDENFGPHHSNQGDMLAGTNAYEDITPDFPFTTSKHVQIQDGCVNCHNHHVPIEEGPPAYTGHEFKPIVEACQPCHGAIGSFEDITAKADYDGNGLIEGVQLEVEGLVHLLEQTIIDATPADSTADRQALEEALADDEFPAAIGNLSLSTTAQREAGYNLFFVKFDSSRGVHNAAYAIQLLQQSILHLDPEGLPVNAKVRRDTD